MNATSQIISVTGVSIRSIRERLASSIVAMVGVAGVVAVFVAVLSIAEGFRRVMTTAGSPDTAIVLRSGSDSEMTSGLSLDATRIIKDAPGVVRTDEGPAASAELFVLVDLPKRATATDANVPLRGVQPSAFIVRPEVRIVEGRRFASGKAELIAGRSASITFDGLHVGSVLKKGEMSWTVVGIFESGGSINESELWTDAAVLQPAYRRGQSFQSVYAKLTSAEAFDRFKDALTQDPRLNVKVTRESDYYAEQSITMTRLVTTIGTAIAVLMGVGAIFSALNTMYNAVSARTREIATLRALGFGSVPVVISVLVESLLLALAGGAIGGLLAYAAFNGYRASTMNWQSFSMVAFAFAVTPSLLIQ